MTQDPGKLFRRVQSFVLFDFFRIAGLRLRVDVNAQVGQAKGFRLSARCPLEEIMNVHYRGLTCFSQRDSVAHGAGGARASGANADEYVVGFLEQALHFRFRRRRPCVGLVDAVCG